MAIYNGDGTIFWDIGEDPTYSDAACVNAFLEAMNAKAVINRMVFLLLFSPLYWLLSPMALR